MYVQYCIAAASKIILCIIIVMILLNTRVKYSNACQASLVVKFIMPRIWRVAAVVPSLKHLPQHLHRPHLMFLILSPPFFF